MSTGQFNTVLPVVTSGQPAELQVTSRGELITTISAAGNQVGVSAVGADGATNTANGIRADSRQQIFNGTTWDREVKANATARLVSAAATTNATSVKASAGNVFKVTLINAAATAKFLKLYNKASAPTVGTDTPIWTAQLPPTSVNGGAFDLDFGAQPLYFATGIAYALTGAAADADATALTLADVVCLNIAYS
jgi:hypothetical protein